jgi:DNA-binding MltR family transcriptional regulator
MDETTQQFISDHFDVVCEFRSGLTQETDRGCALMAAEYLANELNEALRRLFVDDPGACESVLEDPNGALGKLSSRIDCAYLLGLIGPIARREMHLVRKIRNEFAHSYKPLTFSDQNIANRCRELRAHVLIPDDSPRANFTRSVMGLLAVVHARLLSIRHMQTVVESRTRLSEDDAARITDGVCTMVMDLLAEAIPGKVREALFSPEATEARKEGVRKLVSEMTASAPGETEES